MYTRAERVFILEHYFALKSFDAVREGFINAYPDKEVPNKTTIYRLVTQFWDTESVCLCQVLIGRKKTAEVAAVPISSSATAATTGYGCKNSEFPLVSSFFCVCESFYM
jgi:hypothetical protein